MSHSFRLFDIEKYRSIQSIVEKIKDRKASMSEAIFLVNKALSIAETDEFNEYNNEGEYGNLTNRILGRAKDLIQEGRLVELPDVESDDMLRTIILVICCPRFQLMTSIHVKEISDTCADYTDVGWLDSLNEELVDILDIYEDDIFPLEIIPSNGGRMGIFDREQLMKIRLIVSNNIAILSSKRYDHLRKIDESSEEGLGKGLLHMINARTYLNLLDFHNKFYTVLELASLESDYTVISEYLV
jgi:hypothetical protein